MARDLMDVDLREQMEAVRKELSALRKVAAARGSALYEDAGETLSDYASDFADRINPYLPVVRRQAHVFRKAATDHPAVAAAVGLVVIGLAASLLFGRRSEAPEPVRKTPARSRSKAH
jgi:hypothetical protein